MVLDYTKYDPCRKIYLSGTITGADYAYANEWRGKIKDTIEEGTKYRWKCFNPMEHFNYDIVPEYGFTEREVMNYELNMLKKSDLVICRWDANKSIGTACELATAYNLGIPIIVFVEDPELKIHPWIESMAEHIFTEWNYMMHYLAEHYLNEV